MLHASQNLANSVHVRTALIKQISLFDTVFVMTNSIQNKKKILIRKEVKTKALFILPILIRIILPQYY